MKKLTVIALSVLLGLSVIFLGNASVSAKSVNATAQVDYVKRKSRKIYRSSKHGTNIAYHKSKYETKKGYRKSKHETKKGYHKTKRATKHTYHRTEDKVRG